MAKSALQMIKRAGLLVGAFDRDEALSDNEASDGLDALNGMLDQWWIQRLAVHRVSETSYTWASGQASRTIGSGGDFDTTWPVRLEGAFQRLNSIDYPITPIDESQYAAIPDKTTTTTLINRMYYDRAYPLGTLYAYPVPSAAATVFLRLWQQIQSFDALTEEIALPPGYQDAIEFNLATILAPEYQRAVPNWVGRRALMTLKNVKRINKQIPRMKVEPAYFRRAPTWDYRVGE